MAIYNPYTGTNDFPETRDFWPKDNFGKVYAPKTLTEKSTAMRGYVNAITAWTKKYNIPQSVIDEWNKFAQSQYDAAAYSNFWERMKQKIKTGADRAKIEAMKVLFLPFKPVANALLRKKGITPSNDTETLIKQVYALSRTNNFGFEASGTATAGSPGTASSVTNIDISPEMIAAAIALLKQIFDNIKAKLAKGEKLSPEEQEIANQAAQIDQAVNDAKAEAEKIEKPFNWKLIIAGLLLLALIFFFITKK